MTATPAPSTPIDLRRFLDTSAFTPAELDVIRRTYLSILPVLSGIAAVSSLALWRSDRWLSLSWIYQCVVALVGVGLVARGAGRDVVLTARLVVLCLCAGYLSRVVHTILQGNDPALHSVTAPLIAGAIVVHTIFRGDTAWRVNAVLAGITALVAIAAFIAGGVHEVEHALGVVRLIACAAGATLLLDFVGTVQRQHTQLRHDLGSMERLALTDALTGLPNRRAAEMQLQRDIARSTRQGSPLCTLLIDVDRFKTINDEHGHDRGDAVLVHVARTIREQLRATDMPCRWAGDELAVLLADTQLQGAITVAERIRKAVARGAVAGIGGVTVSIGIAACDPLVDDVRTLMRRADEGLYRAKRLGRNRFATTASVLPTMPDANQGNLITN